MDKVTAKDSAVPTASTEPSLNSGEVVNIPGEKGDIALKFIHDYGHLTYTLEEEKAVLKKIDMRLMPLMFISYMIVYMDKSILGQAAVYGIRQDLNFKGQDYSWASSIFYFGFLAIQPFGAWFLTIFPPGKFVTITVVTWAVILFLTPAVHNFGGMAAMRMLLGLAEGGVAPAFVLITGTWYTQSEIPIRICIWYCGNGAAIVIQSVLSYGIGHINTGIPVWKWFYIIFGLIAFFWSIFCYFWMPDNMVSAKFLNDHEKAIAIDRIRRNRTGVQNPEFKKGQVMEALMDFKTWWACVYTIIWMVPMSAIATFGSIVINGFGFGVFESSLLNIPLGVVEDIVLLAAGYAAMRFENVRCLIMSVSCVPAVAGAAMINYLPASNRTGRLIGFYLTSCGNAALPLLWSFQNSNTAGTTKRTVVNAIQCVAYSLGFIIGPQVFISSEAPGYKTAFKIMFIFFIIAAVGPWSYWAWVTYLNKQKAKHIAANAEANITAQDEEFLDLTDREQLRFVYCK